jgi:hypothetical protein
VAPDWLLSSAWAKLPAPSDEAKAKAAEAAAKTAWSGKVEAFKLCKSMDSVATGYFAQAKKDGKDVKPAAATSALCRPGSVCLHARRHLPRRPPQPLPRLPAAAPAVAAAPKK